MRAQAIVYLAVCLVLFDACSVGLSSITHADVTPVPTNLYQPQPHVTAQFCTDDTAYYPRTYFTAANTLVARHLVQAIVPNWGGAVLYVTLITGNTASPFQSFTPFVVNPIPGYPPVPTPIPVPTATNPLAQTSVTQQSHNQDDKNIEQYNSVVTTINNTVLQAKNNTLRNVQRLLSLNPPVDGSGSDIWGCLQVARSRFQQEAGTKLLLIASAMQNTTNVNFTPDFVASRALEGVIVKVIYFYTSSSQQYDQLTGQWTQIFNDAGASSVQFVDPAHSNTIDDVFGTCWIPCLQPTM